MNNNKTILVNSWYATYIDGNVTELEHYLKTQFHPIINKLANKVKLVKGVLFFIAGKKFDIIITHTADQLKKTESFYLNLYKVLLKNVYQD
jgi:hypothetical protein